MHQIVLESALKDLLVGEIQFALAVFAVGFELPLVLDPIFVDCFEVLVVEWLFQRTDLFVVKDTLSPQLVLLPVSLVGDAVVGVVESSLAVHFVFFPLSNILAAFVVIEHSLSMADVIEFGTFVPSSDVGFIDIFQLLFGLLIEYLFGLNLGAVHGGCVCVDVGEWERVGAV